MRMEHLPEGSPECPLIRLYEFSRDDLLRLCDLLSDLASGKREVAALHEQPFIQPLAQCRLVLRVGKSDEGIKSADDAFECTLTPEGWQDQLERASPLTEVSNADAFQWLLYDVPSDVALLLSRTGRW